MPGPLPKAEGNKLRRNAATYDWTYLPASGREGDPPPLPEYREWSEATRSAWREWWSTPQAITWDQSGRSLHRWALLFDKIVTDPDAPVSIHAQLQAIEDRHGFSPSYMAKLRWRIVDDASASTPLAPSGRSARDRRLKAV